VPKSSGVVYGIIAVQTSATQSLARPLPDKKKTRWKQRNEATNQVRTSPKSTGKNLMGNGRPFSSLGAVGLVGACDRGSMSEALRNVKNTSSDTSGSYSVCSGTRLGYSTTEYCIYQFMPTSNA
jgi:hypothetical protein